MNKFITLWVLSFLFLTGCATLESKVRVTSNLRIYEFNDLSSQYMARPTFVSVLNYSNKKLLHVSTNEYGKVGYEPEKVNHIYFSQSNVDKYITLIDKYLNWESIAIERNDLLDKQIGEAEGHHPLLFTLYSSNAKNHYLVITTNTGVVNMWPTYFPRQEALNLRILLLNFKANKFDNIDANEFYH